MRFKQHPTHLLNLPELEEERDYLEKRLYRLGKLRRLGIEVEPDYAEVSERENLVDVEVRERRLRMAEIPG